MCPFWIQIVQSHTHDRLMAHCPGLPRWAGTRKVKPIWILLKRETVSGSGISWAMCKSAPRSRQITTPAPYHSVFYRPGALPAAQPTVSMRWNSLVMCQQFCTPLTLEHLVPLKLRPYGAIQICLLLLLTLWPSDSPDRNPVHYKIWGLLQQRVYRRKIQNVDELRQRIVEE